MPRLRPSVARSSPVGHRGGAGGDAGEDDGLADSGHGELAAEGGGGGGVRRYAGRHVVRDLRGVEAAHLLGHRAEHRRVAGVQAGDVEAGLVGGGEFGEDLVQVEFAVSTLRAPGGQWSRSSTGTSAPAYRQTGEDAIRSRPADGDQIGRARPCPDEVHGHLVTLQAPVGRARCHLVTLQIVTGMAGRQPVMVPTGRRAGRPGGRGRRPVRRTSGRSAPRSPA